MDNRLTRLQEQMQKVWERWEDSTSAGERDMWRRRFEDLEARERELIEERKYAHGQH
jgi:hypothetical protein